MEIKQKVIEAKNRLTNKTDYYKSSQTKGKTKWNQMNQIKENKISFETNFKPMRHEIKTWSYLELY